MCPADDLRPDERILRFEGRCIYFFKTVSADVIVSVAGRRTETGLADLIFLHRMKNLDLIKFCDGIDPAETIPQRSADRVAVIQHVGVDSRSLVLLFSKIL